MKSQDIYHVIGFPVKHSISPKIQMQLATEYNQHMLFTAVEISPQNLESRIAEFKADKNIKGLSVTVPHKESVYAMCDSADDTAKAVGAASNVVFTADRKMIALNYDGLGIVNDIKNNHHIDFIGKKVLIIGAGGAAKAVVAAIIGQNPISITVANRTKSKAVDIQKLFLHKFNVLIEDYEKITNTYDIIINSTSASIGGQMLPITTNNFTNNGFGYDLMYADNGTVFTNWCDANGIKFSDGKGMLLELSKAVFKFWRKL